MNTRWIAPSLMCADIMNMKKSISELENSGCDLLHIDIMDGCFVPNYTFGTDLVKVIRENTSIPLDIHLMVERAESKIELFSFSEGDYVSIHAESCTHLNRAIKKIRDLGAHPAVALNPATPIELISPILNEIDMILVMTVDPGFAGQKIVPYAFEKIKDVKLFLDQRNLELLIEVDGNISFKNAEKMSACGANVYVGGSSSVFSPEESIQKNVEKMRNILSRSTQ